MLSQVRAYFTPDEKFLLSELVEPFNDAINTSGNDNAKNLKRENAWNEAMEKYNASDITKTPRTSRQLKICCNARRLQCPTQSGINV
jgi:hypothetical protein